MITKEVEVTNQFEKHDNPVAELVQLACTFESEVFMCAGEKKINVKSIMGVMAAYKVLENDVVTIEASGNDETDAVEAIAKFLC